MTATATRDGFVTVTAPNIPPAAWITRDGMTPEAWQAWALAFGETFADRCERVDAGAGLAPALSRAARPARVARGALFAIETAVRSGHPEAADVAL
jgi:hypothetical protein